ncbi:MAG: 2-oxoglutarate dehydrogenase E1 component [Halobacteriovoraceae bacterium]|nr:2-oxoglutarate dehydrogenase E1 component [Halobacteriovoraceae bacterium]|tara:strand:+ start:241973 stop:244702 length:2730 start_codon:yes stop_codon:yes gene_type:complete
MKRIDDFTHLSSSDNQYVDSLYETYRNNPEELDESWVSFFRGFEFQMGGAVSGADISNEQMRKEFNVFRLIQSYRARGHLLSDTNPIRPRRNRHAHISLEDYDLTEADLQNGFLCGEFVGLGAGATLKQIMDHLHTIYCGKIGIEYMHSNNTEIRRWCREYFESKAKEINYPLEYKKRILKKLNQAEIFENFLQNKFIGQKRFSLEGGETTIPALDSLINKGAELGAKEFVIGMAHRGRLNVLANTIGKTYEYIFKEFEGGSVEDAGPEGDGDVKYHLGFTNISEAAGGQEVYLKILPNPSHLEAVAPVVNGYCRSQIDIEYKGDESRILPIVIHGDAAVAGQGVVYESLQMSELDGYRNGGSIHFVINNQIGFTTDFQDGRSAHYSTSVAKMLDTLILHVNGDEPEQVCFAMEMAAEFRQKFKKDVWVDMVCYRKHGHNEGDEPKYTQPHLYGLVAKHKNPRELYMEKLIKAGSIEKNLAKEMQDDFKKELSDRFNMVKQEEIPQRRKGPHKEWLNLRWSKPEDFIKSPDTSVKKADLEKILEAVTSTPEGFKTLRKAQKILDQRRKAYDSDQLDWATAELLAYGSLLQQKYNIRFTGQDVIRGTFSHRHAKVFDEFTNESYCGLDHIQDEQGKMAIYNSFLSEYAVLGFEYGYSQGSPWALNVWEAQFGDFSNGAQIMIDQFISAAESKWRRMSGLVMLLPHGYEGMGPEHSSARPERYLQLAAEYNMVVANFTTPANFFHAIRRQLTWEFRKPLVVFTPKSLLRDPRCVSSVKDLTDGSFQEVIEDEYCDTKKVKKVLFCSGKVYFSLLERQQKDERKDVAIIRLEQLYPLASEKIKEIKKKYSKAEFVWVQEEPYNMGAWTYLLRWRDLFSDFDCVARKSSASPATGFAKVHQREQDELVDKSFS